MRGLHSCFPAENNSDLGYFKKFSLNINAGQLDDDFLARNCLQMRESTFQALQ